MKRPPKPRKSAGRGRPGGASLPEKRAAHRKAPRNAAFPSGELRVHRRVGDNPPYLVRLQRAQGTPLSQAANCASIGGLGTTRPTSCVCSTPKERRFPKRRMARPSAGWGQPALPRACAARPRNAAFPSGEWRVHRRVGDNPPYLVRCAAHPGSPDTKVPRIPVIPTDLSAFPLLRFLLRWGPAVAP
jgi:hypothetical protein